MSYGINTAQPSGGDPITVTAITPTNFCIAILNENLFNLASQINTTHFVIPLRSSKGCSDLEGNCIGSPKCDNGFDEQASCLATCKGGGWIVCCNEEDECEGF